MTIWQSFVLGIIQGLTEFLPISSSAHLVLVPALFDWKIAQSEIFIFSVLVQWGTLVAVLFYFWKELFPIGIAMLETLRTRKIANENARLGFYILLGTIPALIVGWFVRDSIQEAFLSAKSTGVSLLITALILVFAEKVGQRIRKMEDINRGDALIIGLFQVVSLLPGISRSGATIAGGMSRNLTRRDAARFSFLLAVPVMIAAGVITLFQLITLPSPGDFILVLLVGFSASAIIGYLSINWFIKYLSSRSLYPFALYCALLGAVAILFFA